MIHHIRQQSRSPTKDRPMTSDEPIQRCLHTVIVFEAFRGPLPRRLEELTATGHERRVVGNAIHLSQG